MAHPLTILEDVGFIERRADIFGGRTSTFHVVEPIVRFYHAIARPTWSGWSNRAAAAALWTRAQATWRSQLLGPAFEEICLEYVRTHAATALGFEPVVEVGAGVVSDPAHKTQHQVDVAAYGLGDQGRPRPLRFTPALRRASRGRADLVDLRALYGRG